MGNHTAGRIMGIDQAGEAERLVKPVDHYTAFQAGDVWAFETPYGVSAGYMSKVSAQKRADATRRQDEERRLKAGEGGADE